MCTSCHNPHASEHKRMLLDETNTLCMTCHTDSAFKNRRHAVIGHPLQAKDITRGGAKEKYKDFSCVSCHNPHSSDSMKLWRFGATVAFDLCEHCHEK
jgi:predicted CXXCH cytochrome family protein